MFKKRSVWFSVIAFILSCLYLEASECAADMRFDGKKLILSNEEWKKRLPPAEYAVLREGATESAFDNKYNDNKESGIYNCAACGLPLFSSDEKYDSKTGWPSFIDPICKENITLEEDNHLFYTRTEVLCARCHSHLGHVFDDGPEPTGKRYCMNSLALEFNRRLGHSQRFNPE